MLLKNNIIQTVKISVSKADAYRWFAVVSTSGQYQHFMLSSFF